MSDKMALLMVRSSHTTPEQLHEVVMAYCEPKVYYEANRIVLTNALENPNLTAKTLEAIFDSQVMQDWGLYILPVMFVQHPNVTAELIQKVAEYPYFATAGKGIKVNVYLLIAFQFKLTRELFDALKGNYLLELLNNPSATAEMLEEVYNYPKQGIKTSIAQRAAIARHANTPVWILQDLFDKGSLANDIRKAMIKSPNLTDEMFEYFVDDCQHDIFANPKLPTKIVDDFIDDFVESVNKGLVFPQWKWLPTKSWAFDKALITLSENPCLTNIQIQRIIRACLPIAKLPVTNKSPFDDSTNAKTIIRHLMAHEHFSVDALELLIANDYPAAFWHPLVPSRVFDLLISGDYPVERIEQAITNSSATPEQAYAMLELTTKCPYSEKFRSVFNAIKFSHTQFPFERFVDFSSNFKEHGIRWSEWAGYVAESENVTFDALMKLADIWKKSNGIEYINAQKYTMSFPWYDLVKNPNIKDSWILKLCAYTSDVTVETVLEAKANTTVGDLALNAGREDLAYQISSSTEVVNQLCKSDSINLRNEDIVSGSTIVAAAKRSYNSDDVACNDNAPTAMSFAQIAECDSMTLNRLRDPSVDDTLLNLQLPTEIQELFVKKTELYR